MKNKILVSIYLLALMIGLVVGCTPTEGEPVVVDRPTAELVAETEQWTTDFLIHNNWRVVEIVVDRENITYPTLHVTRITFWQRENGDEGVGSSVPCDSTGPTGFASGQVVNFDESNQLIQFVNYGDAILIGCASKEVMEGDKLLNSLLTQETIAVIRNGNQLNLSGEKGSLTLEIDNAPIAWDTPMPTSTPNDNGYAQMYVTGHRLAEFIMAMPIPFTYEYIVDGEPVFIYTPDPEQWMVEALALEENAQKGDGTPLPFSLENVQLVQQGQVIVIESVDTQTESWTTDLLQGNSWRVVEAINNTELLTYETLPLTRIQISDELKLSLIVPCKSTGLNRDSAQFQLALDEATQVMTVYQFGRDLEKDICGDRVSDQVNELFHLFFDMKTVTWVNEQLLFEGEQGRLVLQVDNAPILFDTPPPPTAYP